MVKHTSLMLSSVTALWLLQGCGGGDSSDLTFDSTNGYDIRTMKVYHPSAYIEQMCYTKTVDENGKAHNPCFACHIENNPPNYVMENDKLQASYDFPAPAQTNPFSNHFKDFSDAVANISDTEIVAYINKNNYIDENLSLILAEKLKKLPKIWDFNGNGVWSGYIPDCYYNFDENGFDHKPDGSTPTGWVAFAYMPFLGTFWPTNGSTDDVLIRLDKPFMQLTKDGEFNATVYKVNLAIVESVIKREDIPIDPVDENLFGVDLDKDGTLNYASQIRYDWAPTKGRLMSYVGYAKTLQEQGMIHLAGSLYPEGTEFLHSVRYIQSNEDGNISLAPRMKELRYAKKLTWLTYTDLKNRGLAAIKSKDIDPDRLETFRGNMEVGLGNNMGWIYQGFIEDKYGNLRPQSYEETLNCMGCHSGISATTDSTFAFPRKLNNFQNGWYHWSQKDLKGVPEKRLSDGTWEFTNYLKLNNSGDEFRENREVYEKFFLENGELNSSAIERLHNDVTELLYPSYERAIMLNKAYKALVETQLFIEGRAAHIKPLKNVHQSVQSGESTQNVIYNPSVN